MAELIELAQWEPGIYQLEEEDLVKGGADGIDNLQAKQLANRTAYLKQLAESLGTGKQPLAPLLTALAALSTSADKTLYFNGANSPALTTLTAFARTLLAVADAAAARTAIGAASPADITNAIANLVGASPAALDTVYELAAALGNDANFAATLNNLLSQKAPLASPELTGNPIAPTPAQFDKDTSLATTAFVQRALGNFSQYLAFNANTSLSASQAGAFVNLLPNAPGVEIGLPATSGVSSACAFEFLNTGGYPVAIKAVGEDKITVDGSLLTQIIVGTGDSLRVIKEGPYWFCTGGSASLKYVEVFKSSLASPGFQKLPSGKIRIWGKVANQAPGVAFNLPFAFPNEFFQGFANSRATSGGSAQPAYCTAGTTTTITFTMPAQGDLCYEAIGR